MNDWSDYGTHLYPWEVQPVDHEEMALKRELDRLRREKRKREMQQEIDRLGGYYA